MTEPFPLTEQRCGRVCPSWSAGGSLVAAVLLMAALFLAHGLHCAAASGHGPVAVSHTLVAPVAADDLMDHGATGHESEPTVVVTPLTGPGATVEGSGVPGQAGVVCVTVLTALGIWVLSARRTLPLGRASLLWPAGGLTLQLRAATRWRPPPLDLAVLCVLRT